MSPFCSSAQKWSFTRCLRIWRNKVLQEPKDSIGWSIKPCFNLRSFLGLLRRMLAGIDVCSLTTFLMPCSMQSKTNGSLSTRSSTFANHLRRFAYASGYRPPNRAFLFATAFHPYEPSP